MGERTFRFERDMTPVVVAWLQSRGFHTKTEYPTGAGICDVVGIQFRVGHAKKRLSLRQRSSLGPPRRVALYAQLPSDRGVMLRTLERLRPPDEPKEWLTEDLRKLVQHGFVKVIRNGVYRKIDGWVPLHKKIVAIELKLSRVGEAIYQAQYRQSFADESYIALPRETARALISSDARKKLLEMRIGLLAVSRDACTCLLRAHAQRTSIDTIDQMHCAERFWRTHSIGISS